MLLIKDICNITGFSSSAIRYYDSQGLLGKVQRRSNNYRIFDEEDVEKLVFIRKARELGFELDEIKKILVLKNKGTQPCNYVSQRIQEKISFIESEVIRLEKEKVMLEKHLVDARKIVGCKGKVCHYIEGIKDEEVAREVDMQDAL